MPVLAFILIVFYFPLLKNLLGSSSASQFLINVIFLFSGIVAVVLLDYRSFFRIPFVSLFYLFLSLVVLAFSVYYDSDIPRLLSDAGRLVLLAGFFFVGYAIAVNGWLDEPKFVSMVIFYCFFSCVFSLFVFFEPAWPLVDLYKGRLSDDDLNFHFMRASGFAGYPTDFGCLLVFGVLLSVRAKTAGLLSSRLFLFFLCTFLIGLAASAARGAMIQLGGLILIGLFGGLMSAFGVRKVRVWKLIVWGFFLLLIVVGMVVVGAGLELSNDEDGKLNFANYIFLALVDPDESILHRFGEMGLCFDVLAGVRDVPFGDQRNDPFGFGVLESMWAHYVVRFGYIGLFLVISLSALMVGALRKSRRSVVGHAAYLWCISFVIFVAPFSDVMSRLRGPAFYGVVIGLCVGWSTLRGGLRKTMSAG